MKKLYFDIETIPADESSHEALKFLYDKKAEKKSPEKEMPSFESYIEGTSFDGAFGRVLCIAYAVNDDEIRILCNNCNDGDEKKVLESFWKVAEQIDLFVGHNIMEFDLRFILQRSIILGVKPTWNRFQELGKKPWEMGKYLSFARYQNLPIFDTMHEWSNWGNNKMGLETLALAMGIPSPKEGIDGSQVWKFFKDGKTKEICDYCKRDVETTRAVYKKMTFDE